MMSYMFVSPTRWWILNMQELLFLFIVPSTMPGIAEVLEYSNVDWMSKIPDLADSIRACILNIITVVFILNVFIEI